MLGYQYDYDTRQFERKTANSKGISFGGTENIGIREKEAHGAAI